MSKGKVVFCTPTMSEPFPQLVDPMRKVPEAVEAAGWEHAAVFEVGCPYISNARATMLRKALDAKADVIVFIDHDLSFAPEAMVQLLETEGHVVSGAYRFKLNEEKYMGRLLELPNGRPIVRQSDGCVKAEWIPAGFMKITKEAVDHLMAAYPELCYGPKFSPSFDLFNHGAHNGLWWGEDYAFSRRCGESGVDIWVIPDLDITHHTRQADGTYKDFPGNFHQYLLKQKPREQRDI